MSPRAQHRNVFRRDGEYWTIVYGGVTCHLRDTRGLQLLAVLLSRPGDWMPAGDLLACVVGGVGSGAEGRVRERVRVHATQAVKAALRKLAQHLPTLGEHLAVTVRTGNRCAYLPDPRVAIVWETGSARPVEREIAPGYTRHARASTDSTAADTGIPGLARSSPLERINEHEHGEQRTVVDTEQQRDLEE